MLETFIIRALIAGIGVAIIAGSLGCFVVWKRMAYFGDSLSHSALLGIILGMISGLNQNIAIIIFGLIFSSLLIWLQQKKILATDTLLGILAHSALSIGMVAASLATNIHIDIHAYLFGDILTTTAKDIFWIYAGGIISLIILIKNWSALILITIDEDLAKAENINCLIKNILFMFMLTIIVAISVRIVGILLITSLLIIPAATARQFATSPKSMAVIAAIFGIISVMLGIFASSYFDTPSGPSIVTSATIMFAILFPVSLAIKKNG